MFSYTQPREAILDYRDWWVSRDGSWRRQAVAEGQRHGKTVIARFEAVEDRDAAAAWIGAEIAVERGDMPTAEDGAYYWADLEGLQVVHRDGTELGRVAYLLETGANDVLVTEGERERLIPFIAEEVILDVDLENGIIHVDWEWD